MKKILFPTLLIVILVGLVGCSNSNVIRKVSWNMSPNQIINIENKSSDSTVDYDAEEEICYVHNTENFGQKTSVMYMFENNKLNEIFILLSYDNYDNALNVVEELYKTYGKPVNIEIDTSSKIPKSVFTWQVKGTQIEMLYRYESKYMEAGFNLSLKPYDGKEFSEKYVETICTAGSMVGGCKKTALPWSDCCYSNNCYVFGCSEYPWTSKVGHSVCSIHYNELHREHYKQEFGYYPEEYVPRNKR